MQQPLIQKYSTLTLRLLVVPLLTVDRAAPAAASPGRGQCAPDPASCAITASCHCCRHQLTATATATAPLLMIASLIRHKLHYYYYCPFSLLGIFSFFSSFLSIPFAFCPFLSPFCSLQALIPILSSLILPSYFAQSYTPIIDPTLFLGLVKHFLEYSIFYYYLYYQVYFLA